MVKTKRPILVLVALHFVLARIDKGIMLGYYYIRRYYVQRNMP